MKIDNIEVSSWSKGRIMVSTDNGTTVHIDLTEAEADQIRALATDFFMARQQEIAKDIANSRPMLLADFTEVAPAPDDDIPF